MSGGGFVSDGYTVQRSEWFQEVGWVQGRYVEVNTCSNTGASGFSTRLRIYSPAALPSSTTGWMMESI